VESGYLSTYDTVHPRSLHWEERWSSIYPQCADTVTEHSEETHSPSYPLQQEICMLAMECPGGPYASERDIIV
jgi:hypothetical protein